MTSSGLGCGWLRQGRRVEQTPSIMRGAVVATLTLALFFLVVGVLVSVSGCSGTPSSGIRGTVKIGPNEPVATAGTSSAFKPYAAKLMITEQGGQHLKRPARVKSGTDGTFSTALEPGTYVIEADGGQTPPTLKPITVKVEQGRYSDVEVNFDSGIR